MSRKSTLLVILLAAFSYCHASLDPAKIFYNPPKCAMTGVWWHWMGSNITKEGIVKDLDWFKASGIASATIFGIADICTPWASKIKNPTGGKIIAFSKEWWNLVRFACDEAEKRNIELGLHNCPGYTSTGGPWVPPHLAMRELVFNVTNIQEQISLTANALYPIENGDTGKFELPAIKARHTNIIDIATVDGIKIQHIPMGSFTQPNQWEVFGLECDKMNPEAVAFHLDYVISQMKTHLGHHVGKTLKFVLLDSYEAGTPNWTANMREEFKSRRGYDPLPYLPILGGFKCSAAPNASAEKKFRRDYKLTIKELYRDVLFQIMKKKLNEANLEFACEPYTGPFDSRECAAFVDRLMTEFWFSRRNSLPPKKRLDWCYWTGPNGKRHNIIEAEAFTSGAPHCTWRETPYLLKIAADVQFLRGINRMILHTCPLQPWGDDILPGKTMGRWGSHFGRTQTWAKSAVHFFGYLNRCQALLQWGEPSKDELKFEISPANTTTNISSLCRQLDDRKLFFVVNHTTNAISVSCKSPIQGANARWFDPVASKISPIKIIDNSLSISLPGHGSGFIEFFKNYDSCISHDTQEASSKNYTEEITFDKWHFLAGDYSTTLGDLKDWTNFSDTRIKYFSGTAIYSCCFMSTSANSSEALISLGNCNNQVAKIILNNTDCGTLWCPPYEVSIPKGLIKNGYNELKIEFTNVWANRLIGDEQEESDCDFALAPQPGGAYLVRFPDWFKNGIKTRPSKGRKCFTDWNYFTKSSPLIPSGLLGPVILKK